jgi:hypothetical protein
MLDLEKRLVPFGVGSGNSVMAHADLLVEHTYPAKLSQPSSLQRDDTFQPWRTQAESLTPGWPALPRRASAEATRREPGTRGVHQAEQRGA